MQQTTHSNPAIAYTGDLFAYREQAQTLGYTEAFQISIGESAALLHAPSNNKAYEVHQALEVHSQVFEDDDSDPTGRRISFLIETYDSIKGILVLGYGVFMESNAAEFIRNIGKAPRL